jgi:hypothetical protein
VRDRVASRALVLAIACVVASPLACARACIRTSPDPSMDATTGSSAETISDTGAPSEHETTAAMPAPRPSLELEGTWSVPLDGFAIRNLAVFGDVLLIAGRVGPRPEVRAARFTGGALRFDPFPPIPPPTSKLPPSGDGWHGFGDVTPWIFADEVAGSRQLALTLQEDQGGCWGVLVFPDFGAPTHQEIANPTDESDIRFGTPLVLRGDEIVSSDGSRLFYLRRHDTTWDAKVCDHLEQEEITSNIALSPGGATLVVPVSKQFSEDPVELAVYARGADGSFTRRSRVRLHDTPHDLVTGLAFAGDTLWASTILPAVDGASLFALEPPYDRPARRIAVPPETNDTAVHDLAVSNDFAIAAQLESIWGVDLRASSSGLAGLEKVACGLKLPPLAAGARRKIHAVAFLESRAIVAVDGRIGVFDVGACRANP